MYILPPLGFPGSSAGKESSCNAGDPGSIPGSGRSPGEGTGYPLPVFLGFPSGSDGKEPTCNVGDLGLEDPLVEVKATHYRILAWRSPTHRSLVGYSPWSLKESDMTKRLLMQKN